MHQSPKVTSIPACSRYPFAVALGGVPIGVPMPPRLAATGMDRARPILPLSSTGSFESTGARRVSIIAAVAVLLMNIENTEIMIRKPRSTNCGLVPKSFSSARAMVTSRLYFSAIMASTKPPRKSMTTGSAILDMMRAGFIRVPSSGLQK